MADSPSGLEEGQVGRSEGSVRHSARVVGWADAFDEEEEEETEQALPAKHARSPLTPSAEEVAAHRVTHLPFRNWCPECVAGRRPNTPHRAGIEREHAVPTVLFDYAFISALFPSIT